MSILSCLLSLSPESLLSYGPGYLPRERQTEMVQQFRAGCFSRGPRLSFQQPHDDSQQSVTPVRRDRAPSGLRGHCMKVPHRLICRVKSHTHKKIQMKKLNIKVTVSLWARCGGICL